LDVSEDQTDMPRRVVPLHTRGIGLTGGGLNADRAECRPPLRAEYRRGRMTTG